MGSGRTRGGYWVAVAGAALVLAAARDANAQAWLPASGEGTVSLQWQNVFSKDHYVPTTPVDIGHIESDALVFDVTYGLTHKVTVDLSLPFITSKYNGPQPHPTALDDGAYHGAFQDFRFALRYNLHAGRFAVTPYVGSILPSGLDRVPMRMRPPAVGSLRSRWARTSRNCSTTSFLARSFKRGSATV